MKKEILNSPEVTVLMSVYNTNLIFLEESIDSILKQTFTKFEFIIINDGSNIEISEFLSQYRDPRVIIIKNDKNIGLTKSLNKGLRQSRGKYIARMDSDDISELDRLQKQYDYMERNNGVSVLGGIGTFSDRKKSGIRICWDFDVMKVRMMFQNVGVMHPTAFIRNSFIKEYSISYDEDFVVAQDYGLWVECMKYGEIATLPEKILNLRTHENRISYQHKDKQRKVSSKIKIKQLNSVGNKFTDRDREILSSIEYGEILFKPQEVYSFFKKVKNENLKSCKLDQNILNKELSFQWIQLALKNVKKKNFKFLMSKYTLYYLVPRNIPYITKHILFYRIKESYIILFKNKISIFN